MLYSGLMAFKAAAIVLVVGTATPDVSFRDFLRWPEERQALFIDGYIAAVKNYTGPAVANCTANLFYNGNGHTDFIDYIQNLSESPAGPANSQDQVSKAMVGFINIRCVKPRKY